jgi:NAD dependent epimerase/dehydratase
VQPQKSFDWRQKQVLVTGAGGFIGSHLVEALLDLGANVRAFVHYNSRNELGFLADVKQNSDRVTIISGDIDDLETVRRATSGVNVVFHLAALVGIPYSYQHPHQVVEVNTIGTLNVLTASRESKVERLVHTSTSEVYGSALKVPIDENHPKQPQSPYSASKIAADALALSYHLCFDLPVAICRPFNTFGPRQSDRAIIPTLLAQALELDTIAVGNLTPTRDFTFVTDTVSGFIHVAAAESCIGQEVNLGTGREISIGDLLQRIVKIVGRDIKIVEDEKRKRPPNSEVQRLCSDNSKIKRLAGWQPKVSLDEGLQKTLAWVKSRREMYDPDQYRI